VTFTVDTHHHILPDFFFQATNEADHPAGGVAPAPWSRASMLSFLDDAGIDVAVTSISTPGVHTGDDAAARRCNELAAGMIRDRPDRFGGFACLPRDLAVSCRQDIEASPELSENERTAILGATATKLIPRLASLQSKSRTRGAA
jgi:predicted TIM-barrel fold metal-dependent hydrolase